MNHWRKGNFLIIIFIAGLAILGGIGVLQMWTRQTDLSASIHKQNTVQDTSNKTAVASFKEATITQIADLHALNQEGLSKTLKGKELSKIFTTYINERGISAEKAGNMNISIREKFSDSFVLGSAMQNPGIKDGVSDIIAVDNLKVQASNITTGSSSNATANLNYLKIPNSNLVWYHNAEAAHTSRPNLEGVSFTESKPTNVNGVDDKPVPLVFLGNTTLESDAPNLELKDNASFILKGYSGQTTGNVYDYQRMDITDSSLYDFPRGGTNDTNVGNYNDSTTFWENPLLEDIAAKNIDKLYAFDSYLATDPAGNTKLALANPITGTLELKLFVPYDNPTLGNMLDLIAVKSKGLLASSRGTSTKLGEYRIWTLNLTNSSNWDAESESVYLFLYCLYKAYNEQENVYKSYQVSDILHPGINSALASYDSLLNSSLGVLCSEISNNWTNESNFYCDESLERYKYFYRDTIVQKNKLSSDSGLCAYADSETRPLLGKTMSFSGISLAFVRFPLLNEDTFIFVNANTLQGSHGLIVNSTQSTSIKLFVGGNLGGSDYYKADFNNNTAVLSNLSIYFTEGFNTEQNKVVLGSSQRLVIAYPQLQSVFSADSNTSVNINSNNTKKDTSVDTSDSSEEFDSLKDKIANTETAINFSNIKERTLGNNESNFWVQNQNCIDSIDVENVDLGRVETVMRVQVCLYDKDTVVDTEKIRQMLGESQSQDLSNIVFIPTNSDTNIQSRIEEGVSSISSTNVSPIYANAAERKFVEKVSQWLQQQSLNTNLAIIIDAYASYSPLKEDSGSIGSSVSDSTGNPLVLSTGSNNVKFYTGKHSKYARKLEDSPTIKIIGEVVQEVTQQTEWSSNQ